MRGEIGAQKPEGNENDYQSITNIIRPVGGEGKTEKTQNKRLKADG